ncbi:hypothetical protein CPC08DRAFT_264656 [Agrocybe pediades]|nr:hypothetical protein CPC08DRAFT_264656 [Agrocybe pediades]
MLSFWVVPPFSTLADHAFVAWDLFMIADCDSLPISQPVGTTLSSLAQSAFPSMFFFPSFILSRPSFSFPKAVSLSPTHSFVQSPSDAAEMFKTCNCLFTVFVLLR